MYSIVYLCPFIPVLFRAFYKFIPKCKQFLLLISTVFFDFKQLDYYEQRSRSNHLCCFAMDMHEMYIGLLKSC